MFLMVLIYPLMSIVLKSKHTS